MRASDIPEHEQKFKNTMKDINGTKFTLAGTTDIHGATIEKLKCNRNDFYFDETTNKTGIVLHSTVGVLRSDIASLTRKDMHVSVSYVIDRSGAIYELFDPTKWSYHLGPGAAGGNKTNSKRTIGIELSNIGPLKLEGEGLETMYSRVPYTDKHGKSRRSKRDVYCNVDETEYYTKVDTSFRGIDYFASFTDSQYNSLNSLLDFLCTEHGIPRALIPEDKRFVTFTSTEGKSFTGICSHVNYRKSGKWDLGPDFDWDRIDPSNNTEIVFDEVDIEDPDVTLDLVPMPEDPIEETPEPTAEVLVSRKKWDWGFVSTIIGKLLRR
jgi:N-acetylmuramoyl-L-alanine amidase